MNIGYLLTIIQFSFIAIERLLHNIQINRNTSGHPKYFIRLKPRKAPLHKWFFIVILFFSSSVINNLVFKYDISFPIHIMYKKCYNNIKNIYFK